jgi:hypothetical protein
MWNFTTKGGWLRGLPPGLNSRLFSPGRLCTLRRRSSSSRRWRRSGGVLHRHLCEKSWRRSLRRQATPLLLPSATRLGIYSVWADTTLEFVPRPLEAFSDPRTKDRVIRARLGDRSNDALELAMFSPVLYADDLGLRKLGNGFGVSSFSTVSLIEVLAEVGIVPSHERDKLLVSFVVQTTFCESGGPTHSRRYRRLPTPQPDRPERMARWPYNWTGLPRRPLWLRGLATNDTCSSGAGRREG